MEPIKTRAANAFRMSLDAGDLVIEFGNVVPPQSAPGAAAVAVTDQVVLPLDTGRRLVCWLNDCLAPHEAALRAEAAKQLPPAQAAARPGQAAPRPPADEAGERAAQMLGMVGNLGIPYSYEPSFRLCNRALLPNRFLLTVNAGDIPGNVSEQILEICDRLEMPGAARAAAEANFAMGKFLHFGFEADNNAIFCKFYLERAVSGEEFGRARASREAVLLYLAFKWDLVTHTAVTTRYLWQPGRSIADIADQLADIYRDGPPASLAIAKGTLELTKGRVAPELLQYIDVEEVENARRSFVLNVYNANLQVKDMQPLLHRMCEHFGVSSGQMQVLYDQIKTKTLGWLAGGVHRKGEDFFTVYYGAVGFPHFHGQFR